VQVAYAIGVAKPVSLMVDTFGTGKIADEKIVELIGKHFDLRPKGIIQSLDLLRPIYPRPPPTATSAATSRSSPGKRRQGRGAEGRRRVSNPQVPLKPYVKGPQGPFFFAQSP
jgi:hypothetical protein